MKKLTNLITILVLIFTLGGANVLCITPTSQTFIFEDFECLLENDEVTITRCIKDFPVLNIPETIDGYPVVAIGDEAFKDATIFCMSVPASITSLGYNALKSKLYPYMYIYCHSGSETERYLLENSFYYKLYKPCSDVNFSYTVENGAATITGYDGTDEVLIIPESLGGYPVTGIANYGLRCTEGWFAKGAEIMDYDGSPFTNDASSFTVKEIVIPDCITNFGYGVFSKFIALEAATLPTGITEIPAGMFETCGSLDRFSIPETVTVIGEWAFAGSRLTSVDFPASVETIKSSAFQSCRLLKSVVVPPTVRQIHYRALGYNYTSDNIQNEWIDGFTIYGYYGTEAEQYALRCDEQGWRDFNDRSMFVAIEESHIPGDANCDGEVSIADVVAVRLYCLDPEKYPFKYNGEANALVIEGQTTVQGNCAIAIQDFVVEKIKMLPIAG